MMNLTMTNQQAESSQPQWCYMNPTKHVYVARHMTYPLPYMETLKVAPPDNMDLAHFQTLLAKEIRRWNIPANEYEACSISVV
jgi:hypothetical protein